MSAEWERGHGFRAVGFVERAFVPPSGKCAFLTVAVPGRKSEQKIEMRTFDSETIAQVKSLGVGETVMVTAGVESNKLTNKAKQEVQVDGRTAWVMVLVIRTLRVQGAKPQTTAKPSDLPVDRVPGGPLPNDPVENW